MSRMIAFFLFVAAVYRPTWNIITSRDFVARYPGRVRKVLAAIVTANEFIGERAGDAQALCSKYMGADGSVSESEWETYGFTATLDESLILNLEDQARWMIKSGVGGTTIPNVMNFIYTEGLKAVRPEAVGITGK